jgi:predicted transcriptional regulator of viral defense system
MATRTRLQIAKADILRRFDEEPIKTLRQADIARILTQERDFWRLAQRTNTNEFIEFLVRAGRLKRYNFNFPSRPAHVYVWGEVPLLEILLSLRPRSYLSYYTAVRIHGLTEQVPKTIYVTHEPTLHQTRERRALTQEGIDTAFRKPQRITQEAVDYQNNRIYLINSAGNDMVGIVETQTSADTGTNATVRVTNVERTLIDITVRPTYSGGVAEVLKTFQEAKSKVSTNRLRALLEKLDYMYPYHQAVGFYLERAGYSTPAVDLFRQIPRSFRFYLTHDMSETEYEREWNLYIPRGL